MPSRIKERLALPTYVRQAVLAEWVGVSIQTISAVVREGDAPPRRKTKGGDWEYPWPQWNIWWHRRAIKQAQANLRITKAAGSELDQERVRKWRAERELAELDLRRKQGSVMETAEHVKLVGDVVSKLRAGLLAFPSRSAPRVVGMTNVVQIEDKLMALVHDLMEALGNGKGSAR